MKPKRISIVGTVGLPARYGGFETLTANLVDYRQRHGLACEVTVYCSGKAYEDRPAHHEGARLRYVPLNANGASSIVYDALSILDAIRRRDDVILVLGVSGAVILPLARLISRAQFIVNIDGLEWKRPKWSPRAARFLKWSERIAVRFANVVVADNRGIVDHVTATYGKTALEIPYGGDHAAIAPAARAAAVEVPGYDYALMLCRIEPENHIHTILEAFARAGGLPLRAVGNWSASDYGRALRRQYADHPRISIEDPVFERGALWQLRKGACVYVHGHSAGGTNPALVEMMHFGMPVVAYDCTYNRYTTEDAAAYFSTADQLATMIPGLDPRQLINQAATMREIAERRYTWDVVGRQYFDVMGVPTPGSERASA